MTYEEQRAQLVAKAQEHIDKGELKDAEKMMNQVKSLDAQHEEQLTAQANLDALSGDRQSAVNTAQMMNSQGVNLTDGAGDATTDIYASKDYRTAFMNNFLRDVPMPAKFTNATGTTVQSGAGTIVHTTLYEQIIVKLENYGEIYSRIFKTNYPTAMVIPTTDILPVAEWVDEDAGGTAQKYTTDKVSFTGYKLTCKTAFSLFMSVTALEIFENQFVEFVSRAMIKAVEAAAITGSGTGCPKGVLKETAPTGQALEVAASGTNSKLTYKLLCDAEAALPAAYDSAVWLMTKKSFFAFMGITDQNGQPIARVNAGLSGKPDYSLLGRPVIPTDGIMDSYADSVTKDTLFAAMFDLRFYVFNEVLGMFIKKYTDEETDNLKIKAVMLADGKAIDKNSLVTITKKAAS
jgi:HK97 family phage major capsid protein